MAKITINGVTIDPLVQGPAIAAAKMHAADATDSNYILVQTKEPLSKDMKGQLKSMGVEILEYVPNDTYLCKYTGADLTQIRALPFVLWANVYMKGFKVAPALATRQGITPPGGKNLLELAASPARSLDSTQKEVDGVFHSNVDPNSIREKLAAAANLHAADLDLAKKKVRLTVTANQLGELAEIDEVRHVEPVTPMKLHNDLARQILNVEPLPIPGKVFEGQGQTVAVCDTGFDTGSTSDVHDAFTGRVENLYALGRSTANDPNGHGTHVAGSVLGDGDSTALGHRVRGTAPAARLVLQSVLDNFGGLRGLPNDLNDLFQTPYDDDNARVHTNSWGSVVGNGAYNSSSQEVDEFVWEHRDCVICFAAGNEGVDHDATGVIDLQSVTPPGTAKNCITIGATENNRPNFTFGYREFFRDGPTDFPVDPIATDALADNVDGMVAFSSRGPTADGRIKPDVVAPGTFVLSAKSRDTNSSGWDSSADPLYYFLGGTSMATPLVAGCAAVVREYLHEEHQMATPSAALVKAILINGAQNIPGQYVPSETGNTPNNSEGFGRVDMASSLNLSMQLKDEATALDTGDEETTIVNVGGGASLKVTLVWTDRPGPTLQNDLDLIVRAGGQERHGNIASDSTDFDRVNNVEQVIWENVPAGQVEIIVRAHRIPVFAQTYALAIRVDGGSEQTTDLEINGAEIQGEINPAGEQDLYTLNVPNAGTYTIDTSGTTDTFLSLFGPNDSTKLVAADDDSGPGLLSLLVEDLEVGQYTVQVRHFSPTGQGAYGISVSSNAVPGASQLQIDGDEVQGNIGQPGESDLYTFEVTSAGDFVIETSGSTDTFLTLFGPNSDT